MSDHSDLEVRYYVGKRTNVSNSCMFEIDVGTRRVRFFFTIEKMAHSVYAVAEKKDLHGHWQRVTSEVLGKKFYDEEASLLSLRGPDRIGVLLTWLSDSTAGTASDDGV